MDSAAVVVVVESISWASTCTCLRVDNTQRLCRSYALIRCMGKVGSMGKVGVGGVVSTVVHNLYCGWIKQFGGWTQQDFCPLLVNLGLTTKSPFSWGIQVTGPQNVQFFHDNPQILAVSRYTYGPASCHISSSENNKIIFVHP